MEYQIAVLNDKGVEYAKQLTVESAALPRVGDKIHIKDHPDHSLMLEWAEVVECIWTLGKDQKTLTPTIRAKERPTSQQSGEPRIRALA